MSDFDEVLNDAFRTRLMRRMGSAVQHDLRSPLQGLTFCLDMMQKNVDAMAVGDPARAGMVKAVDMARRELARLERASRDLLAGAGIVEEHASRFDLAQLAREVAHQFVTEAAMRGVEFVVAVPADPVYVNGPRAEIGRAIIVCIVDALDSVPGGGRTEVAVRADGDSATVEISCVRTAPAAREADEYSLTSMGLRFARESVEARGGEFILEENGTAQERATRVRLPLAP